MTWHEDISLEVIVEFQRLQVTSWDRIEERLWTIVNFAESDSEPHDWWRRRSGDARYATEYARARIARLKAVTVAVRVCIGCRKFFELSAYREGRARDRVCSTKCRGASRRNIERVTMDGESMPLARWAERYGIDLKTVCVRRKRGWSVRKALTWPLANRGQDRSAA